MTLSAVARDAGVSRNTVRRHFGTVQEYLDALFEHLIVDFVQMSYVIDDATANPHRARVFAWPDDLDALDLRTAAQAFAEQELAHWAPDRVDPDGFSPHDWNLVWLHCLITLDDHPDVARRMAAVDHAAYESLAAGLYEPVLTLLGRRPVPPLTAVDLAEMVSSVFDGYGIRQIVNDAAARRRIDFDGVSWRGAALAAWAIVDRLTEPVPDDGEAHT